MYESPINIQELTRDIQQNIKQDQEKKVMECIWEYGIKVDKEELIKALKYDRDQYTKGYNDALDKIRAEIERQEKWLSLIGYTAYNVDISFASIKAVIAESEGQICINH